MLYDTPLAPMGIPVRKSRDSAILAAPEEVAPCNVGTCGDTPSISVWHGSADNDPAIFDADVDAEPWTQHALVSNGFGDLAITATADSAKSTSYELYHTARAHRAFVLGGTISAVVRAAVTMVRRVYARYEQRWHAGTIYDALSQLDDRTLRDLGFDRSEISSVAAEVAGEAERTRVRAL